MSRCNFQVRLRPNPGRSLVVGGAETIDLRGTEPASHRPHVGGSGTPFRLPRLNINGSSCQPPLHPGDTDHSYSVWSHHGYDVYSTKPVDMAVASSQMATSPRAVCQELRRGQISRSFPKFQQAMISPVLPSQHRFYAGSVSDPALHKHMMRRNRGQSPEGAMSGMHRPEPSTTPLPRGRCSSTVKSAQSIRWTLSPYKNLNYDKKGRSKTQGPYSREFTVTCMAPNSWLRMKLGRSRTTMA